MSSLLLELGSSASRTGGAHHGVIYLSERGLVSIISSSADTIPADASSSSSLRGIVRFALPTPVAALNCHSSIAVDTSPK